MRKIRVSSNQRPYIFLMLLTVGAVIVHGYHPAVEDGEIYLPGIKKLLNPDLYPFGAEFFLNHARLTLFDELIAASVRISHLSFDVTIFIWYVVSIFLTLLASWRLSLECFKESEARWAAVGMVAALLTLPVAGTALYIADEYLTSRSIVTFAVLFAIWNALKGRKFMWALWSLIAVCVHPLMAVFGVSYTLLLWWNNKRSLSFEGVGCLAIPVVFSFLDLAPKPSQAYQQAVATRSYFFVLQWHWYEWLGVVAPLLLLWLMGRLLENRSHSAIRLMSRSLVAYGFLYLVAAFALTIPERFQAEARFQPMRSLHLLFILMLILGGGLLGQFILRRQVWRWVALFMPVCISMFVVQRQLFPASPHIEWPNSIARNDWLRAFDWIRHNTPVDAIFALDPDYMNKNDEHGFRAIAERSRLADAVKDSGAVTMFPEMPAADHWLEQLRAQNNWEHFQEKDFQRLKSVYGVSWVVLQGQLSPNFVCPYENQTLRVCRIEN